MTLKVSTGLRNLLLDTSSLKDILDGGSIKIYSGTPPVDADTEIGVGNTLLCTVTEDGLGGGLDMASAAAAGILNKDSGQVWKGTNVATGTATFYRHVAAGDTGVTSLTQPRLQGAIANVGAELNLSSTALVNGADQAIDYYYVGAPTL